MSTETPGTGVKRMSCMGGVLITRASTAMTLDQGFVTHNKDMMWAFHLWDGCRTGGSQLHLGFRVNLLKICQLT